MSEILKLFNESKYLSSKHKKYFQAYDEILFKYKDKKVVMVEIGVQNGGSLDIWRNFFAKNSRIIGVDLNPDCKIFEKDGYEIFIGDQSKNEFWEDFFNKVGKVDIIIDDGGHTNEQQIITAVNCIPNINNEGVFVTEDTHSSYLKEFGNPSKYSFINFAKKTIDDVNFTFPNLKSFKFTLNKFIYSIEFLESLVIFKINQERCFQNIKIFNLGISSSYKDFRWENFYFKFFNKKYINFLKKFYYFLKIRKYFS